MALTDIGKGVTEGLSKEFSEKASKAAGKAANKGAERAETHLFGLGPEDEALYALAYKRIRGTDKKQSNALKEVVRNFMNTRLSSGQKNWFRRVVAEMGVKDGAGFLREFALLDDDETRMQEAQSCGLVTIPALKQVVEEIRDELGDFFRRDIARLLDGEGGE